MVTFKQIAVAKSDGYYVLFALDELGRVWRFGDVQNKWQLLPLPEKPSSLS